MPFIGASRSIGGSFVIACYCAGDRPGSFRTNATISQIRRSSCVFPHAGIAVILIPCLMIQNCSEAERFEPLRSEEHTSELQSLMRISYAVFCLKKKKKRSNIKRNITTYNRQIYNQDD